MVGLNYPSKTLLQDVGIGGSCDGMVVRIGFANGSLEVKIYSLRTDSWKKIQDFPTNIIGFHSMDLGKLVNGSLNWVGTNPSNHSWVITALDLAEETYREIPQPNYGRKFSRLSIWVLRGNLCVVCEDAFYFC
ncbi:F-box/kelch-repeat protein [Camellia lanceoleosa]|uniref:F-box/kelch-repeat protein n=1 Tax=Camellia lanceoleosa TaxID=1840588 RepID=A0ACC0GVP7_9ERIC|nr:F-box/kelch-repeat protein [Camellia lanceoleosa]